MEGNNKSIDYIDITNELPSESVLEENAAPLKKN